MASGIWSSVSGAVAQQRLVDTVANNLANADTTSFKKDAPTFKEYVTALEKIDAPSKDIPWGPIKDKDLYKLDSQDKSYVVTDSTYTDYAQGTFKVTENPMDFAIDGKGFFEVNTPFGVRYTRHGSFKIATDGRLVTSEGYPVLALETGGLATALPATVVQPSQGRQDTQGRVPAEQYTPPPEVQARFINLAGRKGMVSVSESGGLWAGDRKIADLAIREFQDDNLLRKRGNSLFENPNIQNIKPELEKTILRQGVLEASNVNPIEEMTNLIRAHRGYEFNMRSIKNHDSMMEKEANTIGKL